MKSLDTGIILIFLFVSAQSFILPESSIESSENNDCVGIDCLPSESDEQSSEVELTTQSTSDTKDQYLCECSEESYETSQEKTDYSSEECASICTTALATNQFQETTTIRPIIDKIDFELDDKTTPTPRNKSGLSISINGLNFGVSEEDSNLIHPNDTAALNYYRRAFNKYMKGDDTNFKQIQNRVRQHLLKTYGWEMADVERLLQWKWLPRDKDGFRLAGLPLNVPKPNDGKVYSAVGGISFHQNGSFWFNLMEAEDKPALFNSDDVEMVMKKGITGASFSLDPPLASELPHPFQKATWLPHDALTDTDFLSTLLHADLWLKSMNFRTEMSARFPFDVRPIRENSSSAPSSDLFQRLFSNDELEDNELLSATRIWIESGPIKYNRIDQDDVTTYVLGPPNMQVKYESYIRQVKNNETGFIETHIGGTSPRYDHFTTVVTENYNEFGNYFPELLRLGELSKLTGIALIFQHHYRELRKSLSPPSFDSIAQLLTSSNLRSQVFGGAWPYVTHIRVESTLDQLILHQGFVLANKHTIQNLDAARHHVREQLIKIQNDKIKEIAEAISTAFNFSVYAISKTAIHTYLANDSPDAENILVNEIIAGITERMKISPPTQSHLYKTMSQSGYDVGNKTNELPASAQLSVGRGIIANHNSTNLSSCYYIPTTVLRLMGNSGNYYPRRGGIKMQPLLNYNNDLLNKFYPWNFRDVSSNRGPLYPMIYQNNLAPTAPSNENIQFNRVKYEKNNKIQYGPEYSGTTDLADYTGWNSLIERKKATIDDKKIISGMSTTEGTLESVQSYDSEIASAGAMQKTINPKGNGEFPTQVWKFKTQYPKLYEELFEAQGWTVTKNKGVHSMSYNELTGKELKDFIRADFQKKIKTAPSKPLEVLVNAISNKEFQEMQVVDFIDRLNKEVLPIKPTGFKSYTINDYLQSNLGKAVALDQHVNAPGYVKDDFGKALQHLFTKYPKLSKNPAEWGSDRAKYETELIHYYGTHRRTNDPIKRYEKIKKKF
ncbi:hypothetical protein I4U23_015610 [Adineta vaga]|nr:hypothetical protein I4U23_015610 [Adineta vaga]